MFPHQNNMRERRVGQPPMAPQHLMGMPQQGPGMIMPMPTQQMQIMTQNHFTSQNSYTPGQGNVSSFVATQQLPSQKTNYHQPQFSHNNPQLIITKPPMNRSKPYRKEYNIVKEPVNYNMNERNSQNNHFISSEYHSNNTLRYQSTYGYYTLQKESIVVKKNNNLDVTNLSSEKEVLKETDAKFGENNGECQNVTQNLVTNIKEKTPMCLVNELARFNKNPEIKNHPVVISQSYSGSVLKLPSIYLVYSLVTPLTSRDHNRTIPTSGQFNRADIAHQYRLTNEQGPAHKKSFTVTLTLGTEEYTAEGPSIKKAQHSAAAEALSKTSFAHPTPKINKNTHANITPTVELNALAMKRGEPAVYKLLETSQNHQMFQSHSSFTFRRPQYGRGGRMPVKATFSHTMHFTVSLKVGSWEFFGEGISPQSARHDAASKALSQLRLLPAPEENARPAQKDNANSNEDVDSLIKSPISLVHEIALRRNMNVTFEVISDEGPPHMKVFVTKCTVGSLTATGEGNGKKISKKRAAENMLVELRKLSPLPPTFGMRSVGLTRIKKKFSQTKKRSRDLNKTVQEQKTEPIFGEDINPISRLIQIQQLKKEKEPVYTLLEERGVLKKKEFTIEVSVGQTKATGTGSNKKLAKKAAAQNLLIQLGYVKHDNPAKPAIKMQEGSQENKDRKVTFLDSEKITEGSTGGSAGRQLKPGIYVMSGDQQCGSSNAHPTTVNMQTTAMIAKELLKCGKSPTADALVQKSSLTSSVCQSYRPKDQLLYLAELLNFQVHFSDFPKGNHSEYLSLVTMSTDPSHVCHGSGPSIEESQDQAALTALTALSEMGLDSVTSSNPSKETKKTVKNLPQMKK